MSAVYVVSYAPADDQGGVGGFDWTPYAAEADRAYVEAVRESAREVREGRAGHVVRLVGVDMERSAFPSAGAVTEYLDADLGLIEVRYPALRQYVPPTTIPRYVPTGGVCRPTHKES